MPNKQPKESFDSLYPQLTRAALEDSVSSYLGSFDPSEMDCLLNPHKYAVVWKQGVCVCDVNGEAPCQKACLFQAIRREEGKITIDPNACVGCHECIDACQGDKLLASKDTPAMLLAMKEHKGPVFAMVAPAIVGQFGETVTLGQLRTTFKQLGFAGMLEVATFADILTFKEALEFDATILTDEDFMLTSCCCPVWIAMIRKVYQQLIPHVPAAVSPMVACGRVIKALHPDAMTVFIGPCLAKKAEAREADIQDAVDFVLTFQELEDLFSFAKLDPAQSEGEEKEHSSTAGRIYARKGGVSSAVQQTVLALRPYKEIQVHAIQADGVQGCKAMLEQVKTGDVKANFVEGMGCVGGCVGGPKALLDRETGKNYVNAYGDQAPYVSPPENPYVIELLGQLGFTTIEDFLEKSDLFNRDFSS